MSEEKPVFTVRDRRLFNPDGTPREVEGREDEQSAASQPTTAAAAPSQSQTSARESDASAAADASSEASASAQAAGASQPAPRREEAAAPESQRADASAAGARQPQNFETEDLDEEAEDVPGADDPASFINFLMSIASNAAAALGMMEHPATGQRGVDLQLGKHWIDVLGMLHQKTRGNLAQQEQQILEGILADLRMQYVSLSSTQGKRQGGPRGFTGHDIIGGK